MNTAGPAPAALLQVLYQSQDFWLVAVNQTNFPVAVAVKDLKKGKCFPGFPKVIEADGRLKFGRIQTNRQIAVFGGKPAAKISLEAAPEGQGPGRAVELWCIVGGTPPVIECEEGWADLVARDERVDRALGLDPRLSGINMKQLNELDARARKTLGRRYADASMETINTAILQVVCKQHCLPYARVVNPDGLKVDVFVSHAWQENFGCFVRSVNAAFPNTIVSLWICATAIYQTQDKSIIERSIGHDPRQAPFAVALRSVRRFCVVRNEAADMYKRIWCCWEAFLACEFGLLNPGELTVVGANRFHDEVHIETADATNENDKQMILQHLRANPGLIEEVNRKVNQIKQVPETVVLDEAAVQAEFAIRDRDISVLREDVDQIQRQIPTWEAKAGRIREELAHCQEENQSLQTRMQEVECENAALKKEIQAARAAAAAQAVAAQSAQQMLASFERRLAALETGNAIGQGSQYSDEPRQQLRAPGEQSTARARSHSQQRRLW
mmetsp:Transcript_72729/g.194066  ORF Transcript_72729/g.194066 Transcript_72729/m.194066 type:complete len:499 (-) Transcript_72729:441-1937(-)